MPTALRAEIDSMDILPGNSHSAGWMTRVVANGVVVFNDRQDGTSIDDVSSIVSDDYAEDKGTQDTHEIEMTVADYQLQVAEITLRTAENDRLTSANNLKSSSIGLEIAILDRDTANGVATTRQIELECARCRLATSQAELKFTLKIRDQQLLEARAKRELAELNLIDAHQALGSSTNQGSSKPPSATSSSPPASDIGSDSDLDE